MMSNSVGMGESFCGIERTYAEVQKEGKKEGRKGLGKAQADVRRVRRTACDASLAGLVRVWAQAALASSRTAAGAGEGIRTLDFNLGKVALYP
jgi:hypothetical protein